MNPAIDVSSSAPNVFPEHKLRCGPVHHEPGGGGLNVSRAIRNLGGESVAIHSRGGPTGEALCMLLDREQGIEHRSFQTVGWTRQNVTVTESATGQQYRFVMPGPELVESEWQGVLEDIAAMDPTPDFIVASGSLPPGVPDDFYARLAHVVRGRGNRLIVDTSGAALSAAVKAGLFLIKPSLRELRAFAQDDLKTESAQEEVAMEIVRSGRCEAVVVSLGAAGVLFASSAGCERMRSPTVPVVSKVGAGDSMVAGISLAFMQGRALPDAVRFGVAAGAAAVMTAGTQLCQREDAERLFARMI